MKLLRAGPADIDRLVPLVRDYHLFEHIEQCDSDRRRAIVALLSPESAFGSAWLVVLEGEVVGYIVLCYGYSLEMGGRDAFVDEFYLLESVRGKGIGTKVLKAIQVQAAEQGIVALHLEVARDNKRAKKLYARYGFDSREKFQLMTCMLNKDGETD